MKKIIYLVAIGCLTISSHAQNYKLDSMALRQISNHILTNYDCYKNLHDLCKHIGNRLTGSPQAAKAVEWAKETLEKTGCDHVYLQEVMVPHWVRGKEEAYLVGHHGMKEPVVISSLGNAVGTGESGLQSEIIMANNMEELNRLKPEQIKGKIVFFNYKFNQTNVNTFDSYGPCVYYRWGAPSEASRLGARAVVIRSVSSAYDNKPHTGSMRYDPKYPAIPAVAISNLDADHLEELIGKKQKVSMFIRTTCQMLDDVISYNVIGEIKGSELPGDIICFGGHLDSWDIGEGAHDDGAGVVQAIEAIRVFKKLGIRPKRTIRAVLFMNEENGLKGALKYADVAEQNKEHHILAIESDAGGDVPLGFSMTMEPAQKERVLQWKKLFEEYGVTNFEREGGGADIGPLHRKFNTPMMELMPNSQRYFDVHHSANDVFENVHRRELCLGAIALSHMVYLVSLYGL